MLQHRETICLFDHRLAVLRDADHAARTLLLDARKQGVDLRCLIRRLCERWGGHHRSQGEQNSVQFHGVPPLARVWSVRPEAFTPLPVLATALDRQACRAADMRHGLTSEFKFGQRREHKPVRRIHGAGDLFDAHRGGAQGFADGAQEGGRDVCVA